jgi:hypothetical protein
LKSCYCNSVLMRPDLLTEDLGRNSEGGGGEELEKFLLKGMEHEKCQAEGTQGEKTFT